MTLNPSFSRRGFMKAAGGALAAAALPGALGFRIGSANVPIGVQLYCVRHELDDDMPGVLKALADLGFQGVEFADYHGRSARELRTLLDDHGLKACGTHIYLDDMLGDKLEPTVAFNKTLGNEYLIVRWMPEELRTDKDTFLRTAETFNAVAETLKPHGMRVGYHNHDYIFETFDGEMLWNILADRTRDDVILQLDTGNASHAPGVDVVELIQRNAGRSATMHVKPYSASDPDAFIGDDDLDWPTIFDLSESVGGVEWYIVEYEQEGTPPLEALAANLERVHGYGR